MVHGSFLLLLLLLLLPMVLVLAMCHSGAVLVVAVLDTVVLNVQQQPRRCTSQPAGESLSVESLFVWLVRI